MYRAIGEMTIPEVKQLKTIDATFRIRRSSSHKEAVHNVYSVVLDIIPGSMEKETPLTLGEFRVIAKLNNWGDAIATWPKNFKTTLHYQLTKGRLRVNADKVVWRIEFVLYMIEGGEEYRIKVHHAYFDDSEVDFIRLTPAFREKFIDRDALPK